MNFLNPVLLPLLVLASLPIIIHLLNRLRYRSVRWAAMMFLIKANKSSTRHARLRQYLILSCRCGLLFCFLFALSRPIVGGWLGMQMAGAPETVLILLDRSASMESKDPRLQKSKRELAIEVFADAAEKGGGSSRYIFIDSVVKTPQEIGSPLELMDFPLASATDTAADIPSMLRVANEYLVNNPEGRAEIWLASDLQASNWRPASKDWAQIESSMSGLPQDVRIRLLALSDGYEDNYGVSLLLAKRMRNDLELALAMKKSSSRTDPIPVLFNLNGVRTQVDVAVDVPDFRLNRMLSVPKGDEINGWGAIQIAADENTRDNTAYFLYGDAGIARSVILAEHKLAAQLCYLATAPDGKQRSTELVESATGVDWDSLSLFVHQGGKPEEGMERSLLSFVESGGTVLCFPPAQADVTEGPFTLTWGNPEVAEDGAPFLIGEWEENEGPLARSRNGKNLPVDELEILKRRQCSTGTGWFTIGSFSDGRPFLLRKRIGKGWVYALSTLPSGDWSTLNQGTVLVPMIQRLILQGASRMSLIASEVAGEWVPDSDSDEAWASIDGDAGKDPRWDAGVYVSDGAKVALNRPVSEDDEVLVELGGIRSLFGDMQLQVMLEDSGEADGALSSEIWKSFVFIALLFMIAESVLLLGGRRRISQPDQGFEHRRKVAA